MSTSKATEKKAGGKDFEPALMELFTDSIRDIFWAEKHLVKTLPKMQKAATSPALEEALKLHLEETKQQVTQLEQVFEMLGETARGKKCEAMEGLAKEGETIIEETEDGSATRDVGIIMAAQKVEHYEIATYGGLVQLAKTLGLDDVAGVLQKILEQEKAADMKLTEVAESSINAEAAEEVA